MKSVDRLVTLNIALDDADIDKLRNPDNWQLAPGRDTPSFLRPDTLVNSKAEQFWVKKYWDYAELWWTHQ
jgi:hypothetical protein